MSSQTIVLALALFGIVFFIIMMSLGISWYRSHQRILREHNERMERQQALLAGKISPTEFLNQIQRRPK